MVNVAEYLSECGKKMEGLLDQALPGNRVRPGVLHQAMRYSMMAGGKRLRPALCWASCEACGGESEAADTPAIALECLHTYTLIHDDLPAMDNDELRRGIPTCHVVFGEANAILAGDALLTLAFELLASRPAPLPYSPLAWVRELAEAGGSRGVIGGQVEDILAERTPPSKAGLRRIHERKTARLIVAACRMGCIAAGGNPREWKALTAYGQCLGLAFQVMDDVLDVVGDEQTLGKPIKSDERNEKTTYVSLYGLQDSKRMARELAEEAAGHLAGFPRTADPLRAIAKFVVQRKK